MNGREHDEPFCSNPDCVLHVRRGDAGVMGSGNWVELADGTIIGRGIYHGLLSSAITQRASARAQKYSWCRPPRIDLARTILSSRKRWFGIEAASCGIPGGGSVHQDPMPYVGGRYCNGEPKIAGASGDGFQSGELANRGTLGEWSR
jgi:hypothetical protein